MCGGGEKLFRLATQPHGDAVKLGGAPDLSAAASYDVRALNEGGTWWSGGMGGCGGGGS